MKTNKAKLETLLNHTDSVAMEALKTAAELELQVQNCKCKTKVLYRLGLWKCHSCKVAKDLGGRSYQVYLKLYNAAEELYL